MTNIIGWAKAIWDEECPEPEDGVLIHAETFTEFLHGKLEVYQRREDIPNGYIGIPLVVDPSYTKEKFEKDWEGEWNSGNE